MATSRAILALLLVGGALALTACDDQKGPAEKAGAAVDEAVNDTKRAIEDAAD